MHSLYIEMHWCVSIKKKHQKRGKCFLKKLSNQKPFKKIIKKKVRGLIAFGIGCNKWSLCITCQKVIYRKKTH
jgi:hypothetical protein